MNSIIILLLAVLPCIFGRSFYYTKTQTNAAMQEFYTYCSEKNDSSRMTVNLTIKPDPPKRGKEISLDVEVQLLEEITSGKAKVTLNYEEVLIYEETTDICEAAIEIKKKCPFKKGKYSFSGKQQIPDYVPSGDYSGKLYITDQNDEELLCMKLNLSLD